MKDLRELDEHRERSATKRIYGWAGDETCGAFSLPSPIDGQQLVIIASSDGGWDHVSVSRSNRCPNWPEMQFVKRKFFKQDECVMQLHVPEDHHINDHPHCLHLWRPHDHDIPLPPGRFV